MKLVKIIMIVIGIIVLFTLILFFVKPDKSAKPSVLCNETYYEDCPAFSISECKNSDDQKVYSVDFSCTDVPLMLYDSKFNYLATCGGMPLSSGGQYESSPNCDKIVNCSLIVTCKQP